ncbi:MAG: hypothetical protein C0473_01115 [Cyanobacteria bacterium DS3.002]|jgi:hypothetical protein|nr:hypothetical protein [Cyanobacteria bacterium DS3.002]
MMECQTNIEVGPFEFNGPFKSYLQLEEESGVLAILVPTGSNYELLNVYATSNMRSSALMELSCRTNANINTVFATIRNESWNAKTSTMFASFIWSYFD